MCGGWTLTGLATSLVVAVLLGFALVEFAARKPSPVHPVLTTAELSSENVRLRNLGLKLPPDGLLLRKPFAPPWTSRSLLVPASWYRGKSLLVTQLAPQPVRADALLADLDVLEPVMQRAYGGWNTAAARGWNWQRWFADWRAALKARGTTQLSRDEAFAPMDRLIAFQRDNHTQIPLERMTQSGSQSLLLSEAPRAPCNEIRTSGGVVTLSANDPAQHVRTAKVWTASGSELVEGHYLALPSSYDSPTSIHCGTSWIALGSAGRPGGGFWSLLRAEMLDSGGPARVERLGGGVVYARLPTMAPKNYENLDRSAWPRREPGDRILIVDMRGNGGGAHDYGLSVLKGWVDEKRLPGFDQWGLQLTSSCLYPALKWGFDAVFFGGDTSADARESGQTLIDSMQKPYPAGCPRTEDVTPPRAKYVSRHFAPKPGQLRIIALIDSGCGSDCEGLAAMLSQLPETLVAGTNSFGIGQFIQPGYAVLPHTGLPFRIALGNSNIYGDNRSFDGYGLDVDVLLPQVNTLSQDDLRAFASVVARLAP